jgi:hypothetical protein
MGVTVLTLDAVEKAARPVRWTERVIIERYSSTSKCTIIVLDKKLVKFKSLELL